MTWLIHGGAILGLVAFVTVGFLAGRRLGYDKGHDAAWPVARAFGYEDGFNKGDQNSHDRVWREGRDGGIRIGREQGEAEGYAKGHEDGCRIGHSRAVLAAQSALDNLAYANSKTWSTDLEAAVESANG